MSEIKWLKITNTMFEDEKIEYLESLPDGDALINIWVKTLCLASKCNNKGDLSFAEEIPYTFDLLAIKFKKTVKQIEYAYSLFGKLNMMSYDNNIFAVTSWAKYQNVDSLEAIKEYNRLKKQESRAKKALEENNVNDKSMTSQKNVKNPSISSSNSLSNTINTKEEKEINKEKDCLETSNSMGNVDNSNSSTFQGKKENSVTISVEDVYNKIVKVYYKKYEYGNRLNKRETIKRLTSIFKAKDKDKKLYPLQVMYAYAMYLKEKYDNGTESEYIKHSAEFLTNMVYDYADKANEIFEAKMEEKYGEEWRKINFIYE